MQGYGVFSVNDASLSNLNSIAKDESRNFELRLCELSFMAENVAAQLREVTLEQMDISGALALLAEEFDLGEYNIPEDVIPEAMHCVRKFAADLNSSDKANFARLLREKLSAMDVIVTESDFLPEFESGETFVYVKNALADEAFDVFSQEFSNPRIAYADSFKSACTAVADGKYGYCILPFEEKSSLRIPTISRLVSNLDLKIVAITPVFGFEGTADMKYALIGRSFVIPDCEENTDRYLEISVPKNSVKISELLSSAELFGLELYKIETEIESDSVEGAFYSIIFKDGGNTFVDLLVYLSLFVDEYIPVGIYKNIE